jgi:hypothetical protein
VKTFRETDEGVFMKRYVPGALVTVGCGLLSLFLAGCPGTLDPSIVITDSGSTGGCDAPAIIKMKCATLGCHTTSAQAANLDLEVANANTSMVGAPTGTTNLAACMGGTLLNPGSNPATGVFIEKITTPTCGVKMPQTGTPLTAAQVTCLTTWATTATMTAAPDSGATN